MVESENKDGRMADAVVLDPCDPIVQAYEKFKVIADAQGGASIRDPENVVTSAWPFEEFKVWYETGYAAQKKLITTVSDWAKKINSVQGLEDTISDLQKIAQEVIENNRLAVRLIIENLGIDPNDKKKVADLFAVMESA